MFSIHVPAPTAAPTSVSTASTSVTITVQWGMVPCIHRNGEITGYSVQYGEMGSESTQTVSVSGADVNETTISSLLPSTNYSIEVAAVNNASTGPYSDPITVETEGMLMLHVTSSISMDTLHYPH